MWQIEALAARGCTHDDHSVDLTGLLPRCRLFGEEDQQQQAAAAAAAALSLSSRDAAGLAAALAALRQHTAALEEEGVLPAADSAPGDTWPLAASTEHVLGSCSGTAVDLPPYLQYQRCQQEQAEAQPEAAFQHWPATAAAAAAAASGGVESDAIQEADDGGCCLHVPRFDMSSSLEGALACALAVGA